MKKCILMLTLIFCFFFFNIVANAAYGKDYKFEPINFKCETEETCMVVCQYDLTVENMHAKAYIINFYDNTWAVAWDNLKLNDDAYMYNTNEVSSLAILGHNAGVKISEEDLIKLENDLECPGSAYWNDSYIGNYIEKNEENYKGKNWICFDSDLTYCEDDDKGSEGSGVKFSNDLRAKLEMDLYHDSMQADVIKVSNDLNNIFTSYNNEIYTKSFNDANNKSLSVLPDYCKSENLMSKHLYGNMYVQSIKNLQDYAFIPVGILKNNQLWSSVTEKLETFEEQNDHIVNNCLKIISNMEDNGSITNEIYVQYRDGLMEYYGELKDVISNWEEMSDYNVSVDAFCTEASILKTFRIVGYLIFIVKILVPVLLIIMGSVELGKAIVAGDEKKIKNVAVALGIKLIAGIVIFFIPTILNFTFNLVSGWSDVVFEFESCQTCLFDLEECNYLISVFE